MTNTRIKSRLTLEDVRPHISSISGMFAVPFDDGGFLASEHEIKEARAEYEKMFINSVALILGIPKKEAKEKVVAEKDNGKDWCWKHNVSYEVKIKRPKYPTMFVRVYEGGRITLNIEGGYRYGISYFEVDENGNIYQSPKPEITSIEDIKNIVARTNIENINKELKKLKTQEAKALKGLATTRNKIKELEEELETYVLEN